LDDTPALSALLTEYQIQQLAERLFRLMALGKCGHGEVTILVEKGKARFINFVQRDIFELAEDCDKVGA